MRGESAKSKGGKAQMKIEIQAETVATVERERATLYSTWNSSTRPHTSRSLEKENRGINKIKIENKITIKPKNEKI